MDPTSTLTQNVSYLNDAAYLLRMSAPETSAHLMSRRHELMSANDLDQTDLQRQRVCVGCGHIMIPGHNSWLRVGADEAWLERSRRKTRKQTCPRSNDGDKKPKLASRGRAQLHPRVPRQGLQKSIECGKCHQTTVIRVPPPLAVTRHGVKRRHTHKSTTGSSQNPEQSQMQNKTQTQIQTQTQTGPSRDISNSKTTANASSKKRAKSRKAGLQTLLNQAQNSQSSRSLSLADFARK